jgi:hypothetical protein
MSTTLPTSSVRDAKIFINYRREDASGYAGRLYEWLSDRFGHDRIFMDISAIAPGVDFIKAIETEVAACEVVLVIIGKKWLDCAIGGQRRLDNPKDFVRLEIAAALSRNTLVIPVLVDDATVPREQDLPDDLKPLARRNALEISDERWEFDVGRLIDTLEVRLEKRSSRELVRQRVKRSSQGYGDFRRYWQLFPVRLMAGLLVLTGALIPQWYLIFRPEPVNLEDTGKFSPAVLRLGREELMIDGPVTNSDEGLLLSHVGQPNEIVDFSFDRARLDGETLLHLSESNPPPNPTRIDYLTTKSAQRLEGESCRTSIEIKLADARKPPATLHFYQTDAPGGDIYRRLDMKATGGEVLINIGTDGDDVSAPGCQKKLAVGSDFSLPTEGTYGLAIVAEADSVSSFSFNPATAKNTLWGGPDSFFQPFDFGSEQNSPDAPAPLRARAVEIRTLGGNKSSEPTSVLSARSLEGGELLTVESLKVGSDSIQINVSGRGLVKENGKDYVNLVDRMKGHLLLTALLAVVNVAILVWFMRLLFSQRQPIMR